MNCSDCKHWAYLKPARYEGAQSLGRCKRPEGPRVAGQEGFSVGPITYNNWDQCIVGEKKEED